MPCFIHDRTPPPSPPFPPSPPRHTPRMSMKSPLIIALATSIPAICGGFTLDAVGYDGAGLSLNPLSVHVPGYGELILAAPEGTTIMVNSAYGNDSEFGGPSLDFDQNDAIKITYNGKSPADAGLDFVGETPRQNQGLHEDLFTPEAFLVTFKGDGSATDPDVSGPVATSIPELASALLGLIGTAVIAFRRRR